MQFSPMAGFRMNLTDGPINNSTIHIESKSKGLPARRI